MNILFTTHQGGLAGSTNSIFYLARGLAEKGHQIYVGCPPGSLLYQLLEKTSVVRIPMPIRSKLDFDNIRQIRDLTRQFAIDIINAQSSKDRYTVGFSKLIYKLPCHVIHTRRQIPKSAGGFLQNWFYTKTSVKIIAVSLGVKAELVDKGISEKHIVVINNGTPKEKYQIQDHARPAAIRDQLGLQKGEIAIGCISRRKKQEQLLEALVYLPEGVKVFFVGIEEDSMLHRMIEKHKLSNRVQFCGSIPPEEILYYHKAMDMEVLPSTMEGLSQSLLEAMALGVPVIATKAAGNTDLIKHDENGLMFNDSDIHELKSQIIRLLNDQKLRNRLINNGKKTALEDFEITNVINSYEMLFEGILQKKEV